MASIEHDRTSAPPLSLSWLIWGLGALFYLLGFFQRVAPAVITQELMRDFQISASGLGHLSGLYFYAYVAMQIPTGILADTLGPRKLLTAGCLAAGAGTLLFSLSTGFFSAGLGRLLIGGSVAVAFVGLLKLSSSWFPRHFYGFVAGNSLSIGLIGAVTAGLPLRFLVDTFSWRPVIVVSGILTIFLGALIWVLVRNHPREKGYLDFGEAGTHPKASSSGRFLDDLVRLLRFRNIWLLFIIPGGCVGCILTFSGLWGVPFLVSHHGMTPAEAASLTSVLLMGWALGGPFFGWMSDRLGRRKPLYIGGCALAAGGWAIILFRENLPLVSMILALSLTGFFSGSMIISFAFAKESVPPALSGTVSGLTNMGTMMGPTLLQPLVGRILDTHWTGQTADGVRIYSLAAYEAGFIPMMVWISLSVLLLLFTRETHCRQMTVAGTGSRAA